MNLKAQFKSAVVFLKDVLFPVFCLGCNKEGAWLCVECFAREFGNQKAEFFCPVCYKDTSAGEACFSCLSRSHLDGAVALGVYKQPLLAKMIQLLKYDYIEEMAQVFGMLCVTALAQDTPPLPWHRYKEKLAIIPIPLHKKRFVERGFNQAELIAKEFGAALKIPILIDALIRPRYTKTQVGLSGEERRTNLAGAFEIKESLTGKCVILVDDVFTTGSTMQESARVLKQAGAEKVWSLTAARER